MNLQVEDLGHSKAKLTVFVPPEDVEKAIQRAYTVRRYSFNIPGFRKGKAPRNMIEKMYGPQVFYEDAADRMIRESYRKVFWDEGLDIVSPPKFSVVQLDRDKEFIYTAEVILRPEVKLGEYKGMAVDKFSTDVTPEEVDDEIGRERLMNAREINITDRAVQDKDDVSLDFEGFIDGKPFAGGKASDYRLIIGSGAFIPGFEEQLIGATVGEEREVNVTFPEDYRKKDLAGKAATFKCTVNGIKIEELPQLDDEFASEVSQFETFDEYRADVAKRLKESKEMNGKREQRVQAVDKAVANASVDIPEELIDLRLAQMKEEISRGLMRVGISMEEYLERSGLTLEKLTYDLRPEAEKFVKIKLVLEAVAKAENIEISDGRVNDQLEILAAAKKVDVKDIRDYIGDEQIKRMKADMYVDEAVELISRSAVEA